ncbi:MAG: murein biosynthesis integral membrane protein MurJ, partial [Chloroflexi bacterium]
MVTSAEEDRRQIARAATVVMAAFILSRLLGLVRQRVIGLYFGTGADLDAYLAAFRVPDLIFQLMAGGALGSAFIPTFTGHLTRGDRSGAWRLASAVINLLLVTLTVAALLAGLMAPWLVATLIAPGFPPAQQQLTVALMRVMLLSTIIFGVSGVVMGALNAHQHFLLPAVAPMLYNLGIIGGAILLSSTQGVMGLAVGVVIGAGLHL